MKNHGNEVKFNNQSNLRQLIFMVKQPILTFGTINIEQVTRSKISIISAKTGRIQN